MPATFNEAEIADFLAHLDGFRRTLNGRQQQILDTLLEAAASGPGFVTEDGDVEGFALRPDGQPELSPETRRVGRVLRAVSSENV